MAAVAPMPHTGPVSDTQSRAPLQPVGVQFPKQRPTQIYQQRYTSTVDVVKKSAGPASSKSGKVKVKHGAPKGRKLTPAQVELLLARDQHRRTAATQRETHALPKRPHDTPGQKFEQVDAPLDLREQQNPDAPVVHPVHHTYPADWLKFQKSGSSLGVSESTAGQAQVYRKKKHSTTAAVQSAAPMDAGSIAQQKGVPFEQRLKDEESDQKGCQVTNVPWPLKKRCSNGTAQYLTARTEPDQEQVPLGALNSCKSNYMNRAEGVIRSGEDLGTQGISKPWQSLPVSQVPAVSDAREGRTEHAVSNDRLQTQTHDATLTNKPVETAKGKPCKLPTRTTKRAAALNAIPAIVTADVLDFEDSPILRAIQSPSPTPKVPTSGRKRRLPDVATGTTKCGSQTVQKVTKKAARRTTGAMIVSEKNSHKNDVRKENSWEGPTAQGQGPVQDVRVQGSGCVDTSERQDVHPCEVEHSFSVGPCWPNDSSSWTWSKSMNMDFNV